MSQIPAAPDRTVDSAGAAGRVVDIAVQVPPGQDVPLVLVGVSEADGFSTAEIGSLNAAADQFVVDVSEGGATPQPNPIKWKQAQQNSDELFRTWYGQDAYMAMTERRYFDSVGQKQP
ncbi:MAG: hypothetical protein ACOYOL_05940 [Chthoniobacterales bacterium]